MDEQSTDGHAYETAGDPAGRRRTITRGIAAVAVAAALVTTGCSADDASTAVPTTAAEATSAPTTATTPTTSPAATPAEPDTRTGDIPASFGEVSPDYGAARRQAMADGREAVDALLAGDTSIYARFGEELKGLLSEDELAAVGDEVRTERVHFEWADGNSVFDGRLSDGAISGRITFASMGGTFALEPSPAIRSAARSSENPAGPPTGRWEGQVILDPAFPPTALAVTFAGAGEALTATVDIPEDGVVEAELVNVSYEPTREIGERLGESLILQSSENIYRSQHAWGPWSLVLTVGLGDDGTITSLLLPHGQPLPHGVPAGDAVDLTESSATFRLPFDGVWLVASGGPTLLQNHHVAAPSQQHGYDLAVWNHGGTYDGPGTSNEDYWAWEQPVRAPADGTVVAVLDGLEDSTPGTPQPEPHPAGNHVVLQTGDGEYLFIAHFKKGSILVVEGDSVETGDLIGLTGNSGNSFEPHIHIHLQDESDFFSPTAVGLPLPFTGYVANGEPVAVDSPVQGQLVGNRDQ